MMCLGHGGKNFLVAAQPCKGLFTHHSIKSWIILFQSLWVIHLPTPLINMIFDVQGINGITLVNVTSGNQSDTNDSVEM